MVASIRNEYVFKRTYVLDHLDDFGIVYESFTQIYILEQLKFHQARDGFI